MVLLHVVVQSRFEHESLVTVVARPPLALPGCSVVEVPVQFEILNFILKLLLRKCTFLCFSKTDAWLNFFPQLGSGQMWEGVMAEEVLESMSELPPRRKWPEITERSDVTSCSLNSPPLKEGSAQCSFYTLLSFYAQLSSFAQLSVCEETFFYLHCFFRSCCLNADAFASFECLFYLHSSCQYPSACRSTWNWQFFNFLFLDYKILEL